MNGGTGEIQLRFQEGRCRQLPVTAVLGGCVITVSSLLESPQIHNNTQRWNQNDTPPEPKPMEESVVPVS
jgi:hypothetical protein